jgi:hypothetical protein
MRRIRCAALALFLVGCGSGDGGSGQSDPVCGDNICGIGDCCQDCGCNMGFACMPNGICQNVGTSSLTFNVTEACGVTNRVQVRFFDRADRNHWPEDETQAFIIQPGQSVSIPLACTNGSTVCYGANSVEDGLYWGVGIDGTKACDSCCSTCNGLQTPNINLTCN